MLLFGSLFPLLVWMLFPIVISLVERRRPSLSMVMNGQRRRWIAHAVGRDNPLDAILSSNLMGSISFFASTSVLVVLALFAVFGQLPAIGTSLFQLQSTAAASPMDLKIHLACVLVLFILAFLSFTLALRQFNHFCIMLGAIQQNKDTNDEEIDIVTFLNAGAASNFNQGIRAYYFSTAMLAWFFSPIASIIMTLIVALFLIHRDFFSTARRLVADMGKE